MNRIQNELDRTKAELAAARAEIKELQKLNKEENKLLKNKIAKAKSKSKPQKLQKFEDYLLSYIAGESFPHLFQNFQTALYSHLSSRGDKLYDPVLMKNFCDEHAPLLFEQLEQAITNKYRGSGKKEDLRKLRVVSVLHQLAYMSNQVRALSKNDLNI